MGSARFPAEHHRDHPHRLVGPVAPGVPGPPLDHAVTGVEVHLAGVELEGDVTLEDHDVSVGCVLLKPSGPMAGMAAAAPRLALPQTRARGAADTRPAPAP